MNNALTALKSHSNSIPDFIADRYAEMEYAYMNENLVTVTLVCDFCPVTWEINAPADYLPAPDAELMCESCADEWTWFESSREDSYLDSYWESMYE